MPHSTSSQNANQHREQQPTHQSAHQHEQGQSAARPKTLRYRELPASAQQVLASLLPEAERTGTLPEQVTHIHTIAAREASYAPWPQWLHPRVVEAFESLGIAEPYAHQVQAADAAHAGLDAALAASAARYGWQAGRIEAGRVEEAVPARAEDAKSIGSGGHVIVATGTASGKTLSYLMPTLDAIYRASCGEPVSSTSAYSGAKNLNNRANVLYISPAKALSADQLTALTSYNLPGLHAASYDGDTPTGERRWIREHANFILTTPDMLNYSILSNHRQWASFLRGLRYVVLDEAHSYRGVFGAHIANLLRRLRRVCALYRTVPVFYGASATSSNPVESFSKLIGVPQQAVTAITESTSARGETTVALWEPEFMPPKAHDQLAKGARSTQQQAVQSKAEQEAPRRVSPVEQGAQMLTDLVLSRTHSLVFAGSRRSVEILSQKTQRYLDEVEAGLSHRVAAYRAGYTPKSAANSNANSATANCSAWRAPPHWSWASTSPDWTPYSWRAGRVPAPPSCSAWAGRVEAVRTRSPYSLPTTTRSTPTWCTTRRRFSGGRLRRPFSTQRTRTFSHRSCAPPRRRHPSVPKS